MSGKPWADDEKDFLRENAGDLPVSEMALILNRSTRSVAAMLGGLTRAWTAEEDAYIRATANLTSRQVAERMTGRTYEAVRTRRQKLGVSNGLTNKNPNRPGRRRLIAKTCPKCGLLLDASWFTRAHYGNWVSTCSRCKPDYHANKSQERQRRSGADIQREFVAKQQALTLPTASNRGKEWTAKDDAVLADPDLTVLEKALRLRRTYVAVRGESHRRGYTSRIGKGDPMKGRWVIDNPNDAALVKAV